MYVLRPYTKSRDYVKSPFRYPGGKFYAAKYILPFLADVAHNEYREPFVGGGSIFFAKPKAAHNIINDLDTDIIDMYRAFADAELADRIIDRLKTEVANRERHAQIKNYVPEDFYEKVYRTYYLNRTSYCGIVNAPAWGYKEGKSSPPQNWGAFIIAIREKLRGVTICNRDFEDIINLPANGHDVMMYLDPPYYATDQKRAYTKSFVLEDHIRLAEVLRATPHKFCVSYDDVPEVRRLYAWANIYPLQWLYCSANKKGESRQLGNELIITNYEVRTQAEPVLDLCDQP